MTAAVLTRELRAVDIAQMLAVRIEQLARELLPGGHREGHEWRAGSLTGEAGSSLGVHLIGERAGVWSDFATGEAGDALDLVAAVYGFATIEAIKWSLQWLGLNSGRVEPPPRRSTPTPNKTPEHERWHYPWESAKPIAGTLAEVYLRGRGLHYDDPQGHILRFAPKRWRKHPTTDQLEQHPALLCALRDVHTGEQVGIINIHLRPDGRDRLRDKKGKTNTGRAAGGVVMLSPFDEPTMGLVTCEGAETGISLYQQEVRPIWCCGGAGNLAKLPIIGGIEALTIAADCGTPGMTAANELADRWRGANREVFIIAPPHGDWGDHA